MEVWVQIAVLKTKIDSFLHYRSFQSLDYANVPRKRPEGKAVNPLSCREKETNKEALENALELVILHILLS